MMKRSAFIFVFFTFFIALFSGCAYYNTFYNAKKFYKEAEKERKKREKTQVVELSPEEEEQLRKSGRSGQDTRSRASQTEMQNYQQSIERASRVLEYYPNSKWVDDALLLLGRCFYYRRDYNKAMRKFDEIIQLYPNSEFIDEVRLLKAQTYIGLEDFDTAEEQLREISTDQNVKKKIREASKFELGGLYFQKQNYEMAAENYASTAKSAENKIFKAMSQYRLGDCLLRLKRYDEAPPIFRKAIKIAPNEDFKSQATFKLGEALRLDQEYDKAIKTFRNLLAKEFDEKRIPNIKLELANNLRLKGELDDAIKWYENIIEDHKRTDASARSYFALGEIEEFLNQDYKKAKENYDLVRSEFSSSLIAPDAKLRSDNIRTLLDLRKEIAILEGREVEEDSLASEKNAEPVEKERDDGPIDLSADGMWINYTGRDRPPPKTLRDLTEKDKQRQALLQAKVAQMLAEGDSTKIDSTLLISAPLDSTQLAKQKEQEEVDKKLQLSNKYLALAEVLLFSFEKPDSAIKYYQTVIDQQMDSSLVARALYSLAYVYRDTKLDTTKSDSILNEIINIYTKTQHAEGARKILGLELVSDKIDSAKILFKKAEKNFYDDNDLEKAFEIWDKIIKKYPQSIYAQKAAYSKAWHYENTLFQQENAIALYKTLVDSFPESPFVSQIKPKMAAVEKVAREKEARQKAIADSLAKLAAAVKDSLKADSLALVKAHTIVQDAVTITELDSLASDSLVVESDNADQDNSSHSDQKAVVTKTDTIKQISSTPSQNSGPNKIQQQSSQIQSENIDENQTESQKITEKTLPADSTDSIDSNDGDSNSEGNQSKQENIENSKNPSTKIKNPKNSQLE